MLHIFLALVHIFPNFFDGTFAYLTELCIVRPPTGISLQSSDSILDVSSTPQILRLKVTVRAVYQLKFPTDIRLKILELFQDTRFEPETARRGSFSHNPLHIFSTLCKDGALDHLQSLRFFFA
ncbi:hypothetical protein T439DRAFT_100413 [Meredithblackwellia eburnea MCA 4105]